MRRAAFIVAAWLGLAAAPPAGAAMLGVDIPGQLFAPARLVALVGDAVTWTNHDYDVHTVVAAGVFDSGVLETGDQFTFTFDEQGSFRYICTIHPYMQGEVDVYSLLLTGPGEPIQPGESAVLHGLAPADAGSVILEARRPDGSWGFVAETPLAGDGSFSFVVSPALPTEYQARVGERISTPVLVSVSARVFLRLVSLSGRAVVVEAATAPAQPGGSVELERYVRERYIWVRVARGRLDESSRAKFRYVPKQRVLLRAHLVEGVDGYGAAVSEARSFMPVHAR